MFVFRNKEYLCPIEFTIDIIGGKWKVLILWHLRNNTLRHSELKRLISGITTKMFTQQLRELENYGLINRIVYPVVPPKVEYCLTEYGKSLESTLHSMCQWGMDYLKRNGVEGVEKIEHRNSSKNPAELRF